MKRVFTNGIFRIFSYGAIAAAAFVCGMALQSNKDEQQYKPVVFIDRSDNLNIQKTYTFVYEGRDSGNFLVLRDKNNDEVFRLNFGLDAIRAQQMMRASYVDYDMWDKFNKQEANNAYH